MTAISMTHKLTKQSEGPLGPSGSGKGVLSLIAWMLGIWVFIFVFCPWLQTKNDSIQTLSTYIETSGIDAGAIYYTEVEEVGDADLAIRNTFRFYLDEKKEK